MKLAVLSSADGAAWEERLVTALARGAHGAAIVRRCVDVVDLLAVAASGQGRVALIASTLRRLDADAVERLLACEVVPIAVVQRGEEDAEARMRAMGMSFVVPDDIEPGVLVSVFTEAVRHAAQPGGVRRAFADNASVQVSSGAAPEALPGASTRTDRGRRGSIVAVWGPTGAPGRTTVAVAIADELAQLGADSLLVDADVYGGVVASVVGLLDESPGLAAACRQASSTVLDDHALAGLCWQLRERLRVLTGIPLASRWPELRPSAVTTVLTTARTLADFTVVDCGFSLETDEELSFDTMAPRRNGATLAVLDEADVVIAVGSADPIGMQRLVRGLSELRDAEIEAPIWTVLNKVRRLVVAANLEDELCDALDRFAGVKPIALLPFDVAVDAALARGQLLSEGGRNSPLRIATAALAALVAGVGESEPARSRHG